MGPRKARLAGDTRGAVPGGWRRGGHLRILRYATRLTERQAVSFHAQSINNADRNAGLHTVRFSVPGGMSIVGDVMGPVDGQPVLLLHGGGQTRGSWKGSIETLAAIGYRTY